MSELHHRAESAGIDAALRTRLEGQVELLEDAIPLLEAVVALLQREELALDDLDTLREAINQLPRIDEALEVASDHEPMRPLARLVAERRKAVGDAVPWSSKADLETRLSSVLKRSLRRLPPQPGETRFLEGERLRLWPFVVLGLLIAGVDRVGHGAWSRWWIGALVSSLLIALVRRNKHWVLLADRIHCGKENFPIADITRISDGMFGFIDVSTTRRSCFIDPEAKGLLCLLRASWFQEMSTRPTGKVTEVAGGLRLEAPEGTLTVRDVALALKSFEGAQVTPHQLFAVLAHVPAGRLGSIAEHLQKNAGAEWTTR